MTTINRSALVPFSAAQMYALVNDIEAYPEFLPWCSGSRILQRSESEIEATVELSKGQLKKAFTTRNRLSKDREIEMKLVEGPFKRLHGCWQFDEIESLGCKISMEMEFEFSSRMMSMLVGPIFSQIAGSLVDAFCSRAKQVYGEVAL
ncbi:MAG: type II toxin-antitoxin system RatA family toxin [Gammaproteobacteria bacterium]|nr:type II toxin-antitoxin system RatA family toxin [Gammaproteobacteria bacterium]